MRLTEVPLPDVPAVTFAAWLAHVRERRGWSTAEAARRLGIDKRTAARWRDEGAPAHAGLACEALARGLGQWESSI